MKKLLLFITILISTMGLFAQNIGDTTVINYDGYSLKYTVTSTDPAECEVYCSTKPTTSIGITIPSSVIIEGTEFSVTSIGDEAFRDCYYLTSIEIPNSVTSIGDQAFCYCDKLTSIVIPNPVTSIGNYAFFDCDKLTSIEIPNSVTSIGYQAFSSCSNLTSITVEEGNPVYDSRNNCNSIIETETNTLIAGCQNTLIPNSVTSIGDQAFSTCYNLTSIEIPNSVTSIGYMAFYSCSNLTSITVEDGNPVYDSRNNCNAIIETETNTLIAGCQNTLIPNSVTSIGNYAFSNCPNLTSIEIPNSVTSIGNCAFSNCYNLTSIELSNSVTSINWSAFAYCPSLTSIYCYAENVPETDNSAFDDCPSDMIIYVPAHSLEAYKAVSPWEQYNINPLYEFEDGDDKYICNENYSLKYTITSYEPAECEVVCCKSPTSPAEITIPSTVMINGEEYSVTGIGKEAFYECENLISIEMPSSIVHIGEFAFYGCSGLTSFEIPSGVTCIKEYTFAHCSNMTSIEIPNSVTSIGNLALAGTGLTSIVFPNGVTSIGTHVINNCPNIESVEIPSCLTEIGIHNFIACPKLESIKVNAGNPVYDSRNNCNAVIETATNVLMAGCNNTIIPNTVTSIGISGFYGCEFTVINIPNSVISIGPSAFMDCKKLENVIFEENSQLKRIVGFEYGGGYTGAFRECESLKSIEIPSTVTFIGGGTFEYCQNLTNVSFGENSQLDTIMSAFYYCYGLTSFEIPRGVTYIDWGTFHHCENLTNIYCYAENVPDTQIGIFEGVPSNLTIYVPAQSLEAYKAASPWNNYTILPMGPTNYWTVDESAYANNMSLIGLVQIDGVNQNTTDLEVGAFCGEEVRGSNLIQYIPELDKYLVFLTIHGNDNGDDISFKLYDHQTEEILDLRSPEKITFAVNGTFGSITSPYVLNFSNMVNITAIVNPENAGTVSGAGEYAINDIATLNATANEGYQFISWTENGTIVSEESEYSFTVTESKELVANFELLTYNVTASANPAEGGSINGAGIYTHGETAILNATANAGFSFKNWTENGNVVSENPEYSFIVTESKELVANFNYVQSRDLKSGWNWFSSYIDIDGEEGLEIMEDALGENGLQIKSQTAFVSNSSIGWYGSLTSVSVENMYMIETSSDVEFMLVGDKVNPEDHPISIETNWRWFAYILDHNVSVEEALATIVPHHGDYVKSKTSFSQYYEGIGWIGALNTMNTGEGYMYQNTSGMIKTLVYPTTATKSMATNVTSENNHWVPEVGKYADNMSMIAFVKDNSGMDYEIGAFAGEELRGSARPIYIEPLDMYMVFITIYGEGGEEISFRYYDLLTEEEQDIFTKEKVFFSANATYGSIDSPLAMMFDIDGIDENTSKDITVYPNPAKANSEVNLGMTYERVEVYNAIGVKVAEYANVNKIDGIETAGVYMIRLTNDNEIRNYRVVVE